MDSAANCAKISAEYKLANDTYDKDKYGGRRVFDFFWCGDFLYGFDEDVDADYYYNNSYQLRSVVFYFCVVFGKTFAGAELFTDYYYDAR